jgi:hypothetical protein
MNENNECSICTEKMEDGKSYVLPECEHCFHNECIIAWFRSGNKTCPMCRNKGQNDVEGKSNIIEEWRNLPYERRIKEGKKSITKIKRELKEYDKEYKKVSTKVNEEKKKKIKYGIEEIRKIYNKCLKAIDRNKKLKEQIKEYEHSTGETLVGQTVKDILKKHKNMRESCWKSNRRVSESYQNAYVCYNQYIRNMQFSENKIKLNIVVRKIEVVRNN